LELESACRELFHPADAVHKKVLQSENQLENQHRIQKMKHSLRSLHTEWILQGATPTVVDVTLSNGSNAKQWKPIIFEPSIQLISQHNKLNSLKSKTRDAINDIEFKLPRPTNKPMKELIHLGFVSFPLSNQSGRTVPVELNSKADFHHLHEMVAF
jgi:hypothetical protein